MLLVTAVAGPETAVERAEKPIADAAFAGEEPVPDPAFSVQRLAGDHGLIIHQTTALV